MSDVTGYQVDHLHVCQGSKKKGRQGRDGSSTRNQIPLHIVFAEEIGRVNGADRVSFGRVLADASTTAVGHDAGVDGQDVGHGEEGDDAGADFGQEARSLALAGLILVKVEILAIAFSN